MSSTTIEFTAEAAYGFGGKQHVARIAGRHPRYTFQREFLGRKSGKRGEFTSVLVDEEGLYVTRDVTRKGGTDDTFHVVLRVGSGEGAYLGRVTVSESSAMEGARLWQDDRPAWRAWAIETWCRGSQEVIQDALTKDPDELVTMRRRVATLAAGEKVPRSTMIAARRDEMVALRGAAATE